MADLDTRQQRIVEATEALEADILDFAARLVAERSTLGDEASAVQMMETELKHLGFQTEKVAIDPQTLEEHPGFAPVPWDYENRYNVIGHRAADHEGGRSLLLNGHLDVVDPGCLDRWENDPFDPVIKDGWLYGRGAGDMKSGIAAMIYAVQAVKLAGFGIQAPVTVQGVIEEECSGNGALACLHAGHDAEAALIPEPFGPTILTHQVGVLWFKVTVRGAAQHVLSASSGVNAIETCFPIITALRALEAELNESPRPEAYKHFDHPLNLNIGLFNGGNWPSSVPDEATFHGRLSYYPGVEFNDIRQKIIRTVMQASKQDAWLSQNPPEIEFYGFRSDGHAIEQSLPAFEVLNDCHRLLTDEDTEPYISTCTTDLRVFQLFGQGQATCYGPVAQNIHGANERVHIPSVMQVAKTYALFLSRWCGIVD